MAFGPRPIVRRVTSTTVRPVKAVYGFLGGFVILCVSMEIFNGPGQLKFNSFWQRTAPTLPHGSDETMLNPVGIRTNVPGGVLTSRTPREVSLSVDPSPPAVRGAASPPTPLRNTIKPFTTGFGENGNEAGIPNLLGNLPVTTKVASAAQVAVEKYKVACESLGKGFRSHTVGPEGAKRMICGLELFENTPRIYSFGSNGDFRFEDSLTSIANKGCEVFVFDPTLNAVSALSDRTTVAVAYAKKQGYNFIEQGLAFQDGLLRMEDSRGKQIISPVPVKTLEGLMGTLGHATVDILKIDISGEFEIFFELARTGFSFGRNIGILLLEVHLWHPQNGGGTANCCYGPSEFEWLLELLKSHGFVVVDYEHGDCCLEISWTNPSYPGMARN